MNNPVASSKVKVISWDVDGTLYDANRFKRQLIYNWLCKAWRISTWKAVRAILDSQNMVARVHQQGGDISDVLNVDTRALAKKYESIWFKTTLDQIGVRQGVVECMAQFQRMGIKQVVVSDYDAEYKLDALGVSQYISGVFSGETEGRLKPSPFLFEKLCERLNVLPTEILHIGDRRDTDGVAAHSAGCLYCHVEKHRGIELKNILALIS